MNILYDGRYAMNKYFSHFIYLVFVVVVVVGCLEVRRNIMNAHYNYY